MVRFTLVCPVYIKRAAKLMKGRVGTINIDVDCNPLW